MFGFSTMPSSATRCTRNSWNVSLSTRCGDLVAAVDVVVAVHQHFRLDDRHDLRGLAQRGIARQRMGVGVDRGHGSGCRCADVDHRAPFGEARAVLVIFRQPLGEPVEAAVMSSPGQSGSGLVPSSTLMPGMAPACSISLTSGVPSLAFCQIVSS